MSLALYIGRYLWLVPPDIHIGDLRRGDGRAEQLHAGQLHATLLRRGHHNPAALLLHLRVPHLPPDRGTILGLFR